jgi:hypothetical protein
MKVAITIFACIFYGIICKGQSVIITGIVQDSSKYIKLNNASVVLIRAKDSIIHTDTRTRQGSFSLKGIPRGAYLLKISYPKYIEYSIPLIIDKDLPVDLGTINLFNESRLLEAVTVSAKKVPIKIRGDTTEYDARAYHFQANASAEDLLKKLQGFQVDRYGNITAQGKQINHVLVDGEEFFGDDPTLVTKTLRADMIDKVQVYNKKTNQSAFTGIDDGRSAKTVNFKLKKESKVGNFGKAELAIGIDKFYQTQVFFNHFNNEEKFALYGFSNNTGIVGLSRREREQYADGSAEATYNNYDLDTWNGDYSGKGRPASMGAGSHYNNKYKDGKVSLNLNYTFNRLNITGSETSTVQENLPVSFLFTNSNRRFDNTQLKNNLSGDFKINIDTTASLILKMNFGLIHKNTLNDFASVSRGLNGALLNSNQRTFSTNGNKQALMTDLLLLKKLNKSRRTLSLDLNLFDTHSTSSGDLYSSTVLTSGNGQNASILQNQAKNNYDHTSILNLKGVYTEPLSRSSSVSFNLSSSFNRGLLERDTYNGMSNSKIYFADSSLSNHYRLDQYAQRAGLYYYYLKNKIRLQFGTDYLHTDFNQKDLFTGMAVKRAFNNVLPSGEFSYDFTAMEGIVFRYNGYATLPTLEQIQPVINNIDPLNIFIGNPDLNTSFTNSFSLNYIAFKRAANVFMNAVGNLSIVNDPIVTAVQTDANGLSSYTYTNLESGRNLRYSASFAISGPTHISNITVTLDGSFQGNQFENIVNTQRSRNSQNITKVVLGFGQSKANKYSWGVNFGAIYNANRNTLQPALNNKSWGYTSRPNFDIYLPYKVVLHSEADYFFQGKTANFPDNFSRLLWNSYLQRDFLKNSNFSVKISVNDILNQNRGFDRLINQNLVIQNTFETIRRYFMLSLVWNFKKFNAVK